MPKPRAAVLSGVATTRVGELPGSSCLALHAEAAQLALTDAGLALPQIDGVLAANDSMALAAIDVLREAGRSAAVVGVNAIPEAIAAIKSGTLLASADFDTFKLAALATEAAVRHLRGERLPRDIIVPVEIVDRDNYHAWDRPVESRACPDWERLVPPVILG